MFNYYFIAKPVTYPMLTGISHNINFAGGPSSSSGKALDYGLDDSGSIPSVGGVEHFLHSFVSGLVVGSTQPPIK